MTDTPVPYATVDLATLDVVLDDDVAIEDPTRALPATRYRAGTMIGRGGMGEVIAAIDTQIGREVAIKRMRRDTPASSTLRFLREARIQGRLEHPAIVPVHELSHDRDGNPFFVMKRLTGTTLAEILTRLRSGDRLAAARYPRHRLLRAFVDACLAIEFAHSRHVIHRDLKPDNIMLGDFGEVYVLDWGVARVLDRPDFRDEPDAEFEAETQVGSILGTPGYIPPEQITGIDLDGRADVFALGAILFEILADQPLLPRGPAALTAIFAHVESRPSVRAGDPTISPELDAACAAATRFDAEHRTPTARALAEQVEHYLDGDREIAVVRRLVAEQLAVARAAGDRRTALIAAGRARAIDPAAAEPAGLVTRLLHRPPAPPREVADELAATDRDVTRRAARRGAFATIAYLAFVPTVAWLGVREAWQLAVLAALVVVTGTLALVAALGTRGRGLASAAVFANAGLIGFVATIASPIVVAPGLALVTVTALAFDPRPWRFALHAAVTAGAVAVPWVLEAAGVLPRTLRFADGALVVAHPGVAERGVAAEVALAVYLLGVLVAAMVVARAAARAERTVRHRLQVQAWDLRQLVGS